MVFDCLYRLLQARYSGVCYARNITDIDDKIIQAAQQQGVSIEEVSKEFTEKYRDDMSALNALPPSIEPMATEHIAEMIALTERLIAQGHAYESDHHVLFAVESMERLRRIMAEIWTICWLARESRLRITSVIQEILSFEAFHDRGTWVGTAPGVEGGRVGIWNVRR